MYVELYALEKRKKRDIYIYIYIYITSMLSLQSMSIYSYGKATIKCLYWLIQLSVIWP